MNYLKLKFSASSCLCSSRQAVFCILLLMFGHVSVVNSATQADAVSVAKQSSSQNPTKLDPNRLIHKDISSELDVPPVFQRPLGVDAGDRIHVRRFEVKGVINHPEFGITKESVATEVERLRIDIQNLNVMNEFGLSEEDMRAMAKQVQETLYDDDEKAMEQHAKLLKKLRREKRYREEMSIGQLQEVANKLTDFYRNQGLVIAQVYVPEQTIEDGVVVLEVLEGNLGGTVVENNKDYTVPLLKSPFTHLEHKPVSKDALENALLQLSEFPGLIAYGVLQPGELQGETDLLIKVQEEIKHEYTVKLDNYGSENTGQIRLTGSYLQNNVFGNADVLTANVLQSFEPTNTIFGGVDYVSPLGFSGYKFGAGFSSNAFDVGGSLESFNISGSVISSNFFISKPFTRSRRSNDGIKIDLINKIADTALPTGTTTDNVTAAVVEYMFDNLDTVNQGINNGTFKLAFGLPDVLGSNDITSPSVSRVGGKGTKAVSDFVKLTWSVARLQLLSKYQNVLIKTEGQLTADLLPPVEQFGIGGPNSVRAFATSAQLRDSAAFFSADWNFNAPGFYDTPAFDGWKWGEILQFSVFADYAIGTINEPTNTDITPLAIGGVGVAAQLLLPGKLTLRMDISTPILDDANGPDDTQIYLTFSYNG